MCQRTQGTSNRETGSRHQLNNHKIRYSLTQKDVKLRLAAVLNGQNPHHHQMSHQ